MTPERIREVLDAELHAAWVRRGGGGGFDTGAELLEVGDDVEVSPRWKVGNSWLRHPPLGPHTTGWEWRDASSPPDDAEIWLVEGSHDDPPPIPDEMVTWLAEEYAT